MSNPFVDSNSGEPITKRSRVVSSQPPVPFPTPSSLTTWTQKEVSSKVLTSPSSSLVSSTPPVPFPTVFTSSPAPNPVSCRKQFTSTSRPSTSTAVSQDDYDRDISIVSSVEDQTTADAQSCHCHHVKCKLS